MTNINFEIGKVIKTEDNKATILLDGGKWITVYFEQVDKMAEPQAGDKVTVQWNEAERNYEITDIL